MRHKIIRRTMGKEPIKKATTFIATVGTASTPTAVTLAICPTRSSTGADVTIRDDQDTSNQCNVGDIIKYVNICIEVGPRIEQGAQTDIDNNGWLEYAVVYQKERSLDIPATQLGLQTLGAVATKMYRGECFYTGCIPVGAQQPNVLDIKIKIPKNFIKFQLGSNFKIYCYFRSVNSADIRTDSHKLIVSSIYKNYV